MPVEVHVATKERLPEPIEVTAYYVVSEALTNVAKHANASVVDVRVDADDGLVRLFISDDGVGGADPDRGSGLVGLKDRVDASGGTLQLESRAGQGTSLLVKLLSRCRPPLWIRVDCVVSCEFGSREGLTSRLMTAAATAIVAAQSSPVR